MLREYGFLQNFLRPFSSQRFRDWDSNAQSQRATLGEFVYFLGHLYVQQLIHLSLTPLVIVNSSQAFKYFWVLSTLGDYPTMLFCVRISRCIEFTIPVWPLTILLLFHLPWHSIVLDDAVTFFLTILKE